MKSSISPSCQNELKHMLILLWLCCPKNGAHVPKHTHNKISGWVLYTTSKVDVVCSSIFIQFHFEQMQVNSRWSWTIVLCCQQNLWKPSLPNAHPFFKGQWWCVIPYTQWALARCPSPAITQEILSSSYLGGQGPQTSWLFTLASWDMDTPNSCCLKQLFITIQLSFATFTPEPP